MSNQELLAEAKRRYPPGTQYQVAHLNGNYVDTVLENDVFKCEENSNVVVITDRNSIDGWCCCLHNGYRWATIVSLPKIENEFYIPLL